MSGSTVVALWDFEAQNEQEISFKQGDTLTLTNASSTEGWWEGINTAGQKGLFPSNYVEGQPAGTSHGTAGGRSPPMTTVHLTPRTSGATTKQGFFAQSQGASGSPSINSPGSTPPALARATSITTTMARYANDDATPSAATDSKEAAQTAAAPKRKLVTSDTRFGMWARNQGMFTGIGMFLSGIVMLMWVMYPNVDTGYEGEAFIIGLYAIVAGLYIYYFETRAGSNREAGQMPWRTMAYLLASLPLWVTIPTQFAAGACVITSVTYAFSYFFNEEFHLQGADSHQKKGKKGKLFLDIYTKLVEEDRVGVVVWMTLFVSANVFQFFNNLLYWIDEQKDPENELGPWIPWAKAFGAVLNLDIVVLLLPVCRTPIRYLTNLSTASQTFWSRFWRAIIKYIVPLDNAIEFHILCAYTILYAAIAHTFSHLMNYAAYPARTWDRFGAAPWVTGAILFFCILLMYTATLRNVKSTHFEIFWYSHQLLFVFLLCVLLHGAGWIGPNFWKYFLLPGSLYALERCYREYYSSMAIPLMSATFMKPKVFRLELARAGPLRQYKEGQYAYINCPSVSTTEWHPFTISSAPQDKTVTFHIRVQGEGSWTSQVQDMLKSMGKKGAAIAEFASRELKGDGKNGQYEVRLGKTHDPLGRKFFRVYGPHSAPTQHLSEYNSAMVIGSGIGVTPLHASLKSVVNHRWKFFIGKSYPDKVYFHWVFSYSEMSCFRWFFRAAKEASDTVQSMMKRQGASMSHKRFQLHIHMTSAPRDRDPSKLFKMEKPTSQMTEEEDIAFWGVKSSDTSGLASLEESILEDDIYEWFMNPPSKTQRIGQYVHLHEGRPNWKTIFHNVNEDQHERGDIGVLFCGNPLIANDLKENCQAFSNHKQGRIFRLHKENF